MEADGIVLIGNKDLDKYLYTAFYPLGTEGKVKIIARGNHCMKALNVLAILIREYVDDSSYDIIVDSEKFDERFVTTIEIELRGKQKDGKFNK